MKVVAAPDRATLLHGGFDFCPGCGYGSVVLALAEIVDSFETREPPLFLLDIGCADFMVGHLPGPTVMGTHGRTPALATGYKRVDPDRLVVAIQGDGGLMSVGACEAIHASMRGEAITIIVLNNGVLADTGGQLAPTTLLGAATASAPEGRGAALGAPLPFLEMLALIDGVAYAERVAVDSVLGVRRMTRALRRAIAVQQRGVGIGIVEVLSACPTHWRLEPDESWDYLREQVQTVYPLGVFADRRGAS